MIVASNPDAKNTPQPKKQRSESRPQSGISSPVLSISRVEIRKTGMNSGLSGGGYQCC